MTTYIHLPGTAIVAPQAHMQADGRCHIVLNEKAGAFVSCGSPDEAAAIEEAGRQARLLLEARDASGAEAVSAR